MKKYFWKSAAKTEKVLDDIIKDLKKAIKKRNIVESNGLRGSKVLSITDKKEIFNYAKQYFTDNAEELIQFADEMSTNNTGYMALMDVLYINTDIMPGTLGTANSRLGWQAAIAHELEGHRYAALNGKTFYDPNISVQANDLLEEIQASVRASKHGKKLSHLDREDLLQDAIERLETHKHFLSGTKYESLTINKIIEELWISKH